MAEHEELRGRALYEALLLLKPADLVETEWAVKAGVNRGFFTNLKGSDISPRSDTLRKILRAVGRTEAELYSGGRPLKQWADTHPDQPPTNTSDDGAIEIRQLDLSYAMGPGTNLDDYADEMPVSFDANFLRRVTRAEPSLLFVAQATGDSMFPTLINADEVLVDTSQRVLNQHDRIWAVSVHGAGMIKRLRPIAGGKVRVLSDNQTVPPEDIAVDDLHIVGRVIWVGRRV